MKFYLIYGTVNFCGCFEIVFSLMFVYAEYIFQNTIFAFKL